jgi:parallel beta-helix repeat protein/predicted outer membrane repeat protein
MKKLILLFICLFLVIPCRAEIIIVDEDWPYDFNNIQAAIDYSSNGDFIFVFPGTYTGTGNRDIDFLGKAITVRSIVPTDPYIVAETIIDCNGLDRYDPHYGFLFQSDEDANSVLAGFTITNCHSYSAIICGSSPTITNCIITKNVIPADGAISCYGSGSPTITNCTISDNIGSGIYCWYENGLAITNCTITGNTGSGARNRGGGIYCYSSNPKITDCTITSNSANDSGGGIYCDDRSSPVITSCTITGNSADRDGGGIYCYSTTSIPKVTNCTISGNSAKRYGGGICLASTSSLIPVASSIIWGNTDTSGTGLPAQIYSGKPDVWFSCIQDDNPNDANIPFGEDRCNIDDDPCFVELGYWVDANDPNIIVEPNDPNAAWLNGDYHLLAASPCIETGNPLFTYHAGDVDMDGQPRLMGRYVDMGADEFEIAMIVVTKPQVGVVWVTGSTHEIKWDSYDIIGIVDIYYSDNNGVDWVMIDNVPDTGSFLWHLPGVVDSNQCLVSVEPNITIPNLTCIDSGIFTIHPCPPGPPVASKWKSLGGDFDRAGLSENFGPELGCVKWQFQTNGPVSASPSIGAGGRIHLPCEDGKLYTLDANGLLLWSYDTNSPLLSSPTIGPDGSIYVGAENGKLYAFDIDGNLRWTHSTNDSIYSSPAVSADGNVYVCSQDGTLYALGRDGSELWTFDTSSSGITFTGAIFASLAIDSNSNIYITGLYDPNLYALDPNDGSVKWSRSFLDLFDPNGRKPRPFASPVIAADGTVYISLLFDPHLYAVDSNNGNIIWSANLADPCYTYKYVWSEPALGPDGTIYVSFNDPYLRAVNPNGTIKWVTRLGMMGGFTLTIGSDGLIYAASDDAYLCVIDPNGEEIARFKGGNWLSFPVITADNTMIVSDENNTVWAIGGVGCEGQAAALHRPQDLSTDWSINLNDLALVANDWLKPNCFTPPEEVRPWWEPPCEQYPDDGFYYTGDTDRDLYVDFADLAELADKWLSQE